MDDTDRIAFLIIAVLIVVLIIWIGLDIQERQILILKELLQIKAELNSGVSGGAVYEVFL